MNICLVLGLMSGCAAQSSYKQYYDAKEMLERADKIGPQDPRVDSAKLALERGRLNLKEARFGNATREFNEVMRKSEQVLREYDPDLGGSAPQATAMIETRIEDFAASEQPISGEGSSAVPYEPPMPPKKKIKKIELPSVALQKYLEQKKTAPTEDAKTPTPAEEPEADLEAASEELDEEAASEMASESENQLGQSALIAEKPLAETSERTVIKQPAEAIAKTAPVVAAPIPDLDEIQEESSEPEKEEAKAVASKNEYEPPKRKVPGSINFDKNKVSLSLQSMDSLDKMSRFLIENPSNTLLLMGTREESELKSLIDGRFESIRSYLSGRGVPEDQVRLDAVHKSGKQAEFEMFLIDH